MKCSMKETPDFIPVTLEITFESKDQLIAMWHRHNCSRALINKGSGKHSVHGELTYEMDGAIDRIFEIIDSKLEELNQRNG